MKSTRNITCKSNENIMILYNFNRISAIFIIILIGSL